MRSLISAIVILLVLGVSTAALAEPVWATEAVPARRWVDSAEHLETTIEKDARLDVIFREGGWVRVRLPGRAGYGWVPEDKVTTVEPAGARAGSGDFQLPSTTLPPVQLELP